MRSVAHLCSCLLVACFLFSLSGCGPTMFVGTPVGTMEQATSFKPPTGMSGIYVIREGGMVGAAGAWHVDLDLVPLGDLRSRTCVYAAVPPGDHNLRVIYEEGGYTFHTEPDKNYFFLMQVSFTGRVKQLSEEEGRDYVNDYKGK